jgi:hypothetical protein
MVMDDAVLQLWSKGPKGVFVFIKRNRKKVDELLTKYLEAMPQINARFLGGHEHTEYLCADWITNLAIDGSLHCAHCIHERSCGFQCLGAHKRFLDQFCGICVKDDKAKCQKNVLTYIETAVKKRGWQGVPLKSAARYMGSMRFRDDGSTDNYAGGVIADFMFDNFDPRLASGEDDKFSRISDLLHDFALSWVDPIDQNKAGTRRVFEIALTVISFNYAFFSDLSNSTLFMNTPFTNLAELYKGSPDQRERAVSFNKEMVIVAVNTLKAIYKSDFLPSLSARSVDAPYLAQIDRGLREGTIRDDNEIHQSLPGKKIYAYDWEIGPQYLQYVLYSSLARLISEALRIRFTTKIALPFRGDNLLSIKKTLSISDDFKDCCSRLNLHYKTVHSGICNNLKDHPRYDEYLENKISMIDNVYGLIEDFIDHSSEEEINQWNDKVNSRLK